MQNGIQKVDEKNPPLFEARTRFSLRSGFFLDERGPLLATQGEHE